MIDRTAFHKLSSGLYIIGSKLDGHYVGCVVNTLLQVTSEPFQLSVTLNKQNTTTKAVQESGRFTASVVAEPMTMEVIGRFGFHSSLEVNKFEGVEHTIDAAELPHLVKDCSAWFSCHVVKTLDVGTHIIFVGEVDEAGVLDGGEPMTYAYYHAVKGGKTPPRASAYTGEERGGEPAVEISESAGGGVSVEQNGEVKSPTYAWRCKVCGYIAYMEELPPNFRCPICGVGPEEFERIEL